ncbi:NAD-dependent epimerase/dehydratase family protein [Catenulispora pinisilvae]|uniref:NAD-dependent epimerase/dehydratase family protein n=1 Tax=Catenulispora pinisilvae TaxID=2705253 RepID=UPI001891840A|nr:NAD(P)-dependent oxidoreductase [Catenulispora pinisilvae]
MTEHVLVTGAAGRIGRAVLAHLADRGVAATALVLADPGDLTARHVVAGDAADPATVREALHGVDAVIHLAAIPTPERNTPQEVFGTNTMATLTVLEEAGHAGIHHACLASSYGVTGLPWSVTDAHPPYLPVDEAMPPQVSDSYGLSKQTDELIAQMAARRHGMSVVCLRYPFVGDQERLAARARQLSENPAAGAAELWTYLDVRDAARAALLALAVPGPGAPAVHLCAPDTLSRQPTSDLIARFHPGVELRAAISGRQAAIRTAAAEQLLGFVPEWLFEL